MGQAVILYDHRLLCNSDEQFDQIVEAISNAADETGADWTPPRKPEGFPCTVNICAEGADDPLTSDNAPYGIEPAARAITAAAGPASYIELIYEDDNEFVRYANDCDITNDRSLSLNHYALAAAESGIAASSLLEGIGDAKQSIAAIPSVAEAFIDLVELASDGRSALQLNDFDTAGSLLAAIADDKPLVDVGNGRVYIPKMLDGDLSCILEAKVPQERMQAIAARGAHIAPWCLAEFDPPSEEYLSSEMTTIPATALAALVMQLAFKGNGSMTCEDDPQLVLEMLEGAQGSDEDAQH